MYRLSNFSYIMLINLTYETLRQDITCDLSPNNPHRNWPGSKIAARHITHVLCRPKIHCSIHLRPTTCPHLSMTGLSSAPPTNPSVHTGQIFLSSGSSFTSTVGRDPTKFAAVSNMSRGAGPGARLRKGSLPICTSTRRSPLPTWLIWSAG